MEATRLRAIVELVEESLDEPELAAADLANRAYLSRYHFDRLVRAAVGGTGADASNVRRKFES
jgi:transcriptional regulator GlxA family with amidase domain